MHGLTPAGDYRLPLLRQSMCIGSAPVGRASSSEVAHAPSECTRPTPELASTIAPLQSNTEHSDVEIFGQKSRRDGRHPWYGTCDGPGVARRWSGGSDYGPQ